MRLIIHRGTNEIGANCVVIEHKETRILLDAGMPLDGSEGALPESIEKYDAVFISHGHQDHYGLIEKLPQDVPVFMGEVAWTFMQSLRLFTSKPLLSQERHHLLKAGKAVSLGELSVVPLLVDHSSPESFGFLVKAGEETLYYTGDFRRHGRKGNTFEAVCKRLPKGLGAIVLEGTMLHRSNADYPSEAAVERGLVEAIRDTSGLVCLCCSAQNVDRMVTAYRAAKRCGRVLVVDIYTAWILRVAQRLSKKMPDIRWDGVRVLSRGRVAAGQYAKLKRNRDFFGEFARDLYLPGSELREEDVLGAPSKYFLKLGDRWLNSVVDGLGGAGTIVYSQWSGYLDSGASQFNSTIAALRERERVDFRHIHTSGHATVNDLQDFVERVYPHVVIPIHTERKQEYLRLFPQALLLDDGEPYDLGENV